MPNYQISWGKIAQALAFYQDLGYQYVEVPWLVDEVAVKSTLPDGRTAQRLGEGKESRPYLVGSAEQSLYQMVLDGQLAPGKYCAASPCFRDDVEDDLHQSHFFKVELMVLLPRGTPSFGHTDVSDLGDAVLEVAKDALEFFRCLPGNQRVNLVPTGPCMYDIELARIYDLGKPGIEVGSYGARAFSNGWRWVYGTGLAEPRYSIADKMSR